MLKPRLSGLERPKKKLTLRLSLSKRGLISSRLKNRLGWLLSKKGLLSKKPL